MVGMPDNIAMMGLRSRVFVLGFAFRTELVIARSSATKQSISQCALCPAWIAASGFALLAMTKIILIR
jgi:hypothetical protein